VKADDLRPVTCDPLEIGHFPYEKREGVWQKLGRRRPKETRAPDESKARLLSCLSDRARKGFAAPFGFRKCAPAECIKGTTLIEQDYD
jgi:hypothetical protein